MSNNIVIEKTENLGKLRSGNNFYKEYERLSDKELRESEAYLKGLIFKNLSEKYKEDNGIVNFLWDVPYIELCDTYVKLSRESFDNLSDRVIEELGYGIKLLDTKELINAV